MKTRRDDVIQGIARDEDVLDGSIIALNSNFQQHLAIARRLLETFTEADSLTRWVVGQVWQESLYDPVDAPYLGIERFADEVGVPASYVDDCDTIANVFTLGQARRYRPLPPDVLLMSPDRPGKLDRILELYHADAIGLPGALHGGSAGRTITVLVSNTR